MRRALATVHARCDGALTAHPLLSIWAVTSAVIFGLSVVWAFATPIGATNDEGSQVIKAVSVPRGQILGTPLTPHRARTIHGAQKTMLHNCLVQLRNRGASRGEASSRCSAPFTVVTVPQSFTTLSLSQSCNAFPLTADLCPNHLNGSARAVEAMTYVGRYPPLYYALVGLPSLVTQTDAALYGMRIVSGLLTSVLIGLAVGLVGTWSDRRLLLLGVVSVATPILLVFGSTVNPSGLEMASALCAWTGLVLLVLEHADRPPRSLVIATTAASNVLVLCRALSPLWLLVMVVFVAALRPSAVRSLAGDRRMRLGTVVVAIAALVALSYDVWARPFRVLPVGGPVPPDASVITLGEAALGHVSYWMYQFAGAFGWALSNPPLLGCALLALALGAVVLCAVLTSGRRQLVVLGALTVTALLLPLAIVVSQASDNGIVWQARDGYPLYSGVVIVAGAIAQSRPRQEDPRAVTSTQRVVIVVAVCIALVQFFDVFWALRRYTVGLAGTLNLWTGTPGPFTPPVPDKLLLLAMLALCATYGWWIVRLAGRMPSRALMRLGRHQIPERAAAPELLFHTEEPGPPHVPTLG